MSLHLLHPRQQIETVMRLIYKHGMTTTSGGNISIQDGNPTIPQLLSVQTPLAMIENDSVVVTGKNILETFDRLEVAEFSAKSLIESTPLGEVVTISNQEIEDLKKKFLS